MATWPAGASNSFGPGDPAPSVNTTGVRLATKIPVADIVIPPSYDARMVAPARAYPRR